jgi:hypothetical protein
VRTNVKAALILIAEYPVAKSTIGQKLSAHPDLITELFPPKSVAS